MPPSELSWSGKAGSTAAKVARFIGIAEWAVVSLTVVVALCLHVRFLTLAGGLWRDEANSVNLSSMRTFGEIWRHLDYDSFPILFFAVLRGWMGVFGAENDAALRILGLIIGLGTLAALWMNTRSLGAGKPVLSLALIGLNPMVIRYGDSTRGYGLGMLLILLTFGAIWRLAARPQSFSGARFAGAALLALLSVQCLYNNCVLLLALAAGGIVVALRNRNWRLAWMILGIGVIAAVSMLPYALVIERMREWTFLLKYPVDLAWIWTRSCEVTGSPEPFAVWLWAGLVFTAIAVSAGAAWWGRGRSNSRLTPTDSQSRQPLPQAVVFAIVVLVVGVAGYVGFLTALSYYTQPWYYIAIAAFAACALEGIFGAWPDAGRLRFLSLTLRGLRLGAALLLLGMASLPAWQRMSVRHTNLDLLAARLEPMTVRGDLIISERWECTITLRRYYRGPADILSLPPLADNSLHRYDLLLKEMTNPAAIQPVLARIEQTLRAGHRVFIVGSLPLPPDGYTPPEAAPAYQDADGKWRGGSPQEAWKIQTGHFLRLHAERGAPIPVPLPAGTKVQGFESLDLFAMEGWR